MMIDGLIKNTLEWLKTPAHYFLPLLAASFFGLFAPLDLMKFIGIEVWRAEGKPYLGSVFVVSLSIVVCFYASEAIKWLIDKYRKYLSIRSAQTRLKSLTPEEQKRLAGYLKDNTRTQQFGVEDGVMFGLAEADIIYPAISQANGDDFPFNIRPWAWEYLNKNPHLVGVTIKHDGKP